MKQEWCSIEASKEGAAQWLRKAAHCKLTFLMLVVNVDSAVATSEVSTVTEKSTTMEPAERECTQWLGKTVRTVAQRES